MRHEDGRPVQSAGTLTAIGVLFFGIFLIGAGAGVASDEVVREPVKQDLQLIYIFDGNDPEFVFVLGQSGFKSVASLKRYLATWPPGSELTWAPGCERLGGEPLLSSDDDMRAFEAFLAEKEIKFVLVPSG